MNYFRHHIGDYAGATEHLTWDEDLAYTRLLRVYYRDEKPIPADLAKACRLVRAQTKEQKGAVESVLSEFFTLENDGWHNKRADEELGAARQAGGEAEDRRQNERDRQKRHREERGQLFQTLREAGANPPPYDASTDALRSRVKALNGHGPVTRTDTDLSQPVTRDTSVTSQPVTRTATAIHPPSSILQPPTSNRERENEKAKTTETPTPSASSKPPRRAPARSRCPEDFTPDPAFALAELPGLDVAREIAKFRDCEFPKAHSDWPATWRNWIRRAKDRGDYARAAPTGAKPSVSNADGTLNLEKLKAMGML